MGGGHIGRGASLSALQRADVSDYRPAVGRHELIRIGQHIVFAVSDRLINLALGDLAQAVVVEGRGGTHAVFFW